MNFEIQLIRDDDPTSHHNYGKFFIDGKFFCETLEDTDRRLESGGEKIAGDTAIPRGRYRVSITFSARFKRLMPLVHDVPCFEGVRLHGGNTEADTHGCPLLGQYRTTSGISNCAGVNDRLMDFLDTAEKNGDDVWLEVS